MAGVAGIEPANADTKNRCLTAWLHPSNAAMQRGRLYSVRAVDGKGVCKIVLARPAFAHRAGLHMPFIAAVNWLQGKGNRPRNGVRAIAHLPRPRSC